MFCPKCGSQIPDGAGFCPNCGATMTQRAAGQTPANMPMAQGSPAPHAGGVYQKKVLGKFTIAQTVVAALAIIALIAIIVRIAGCNNKYLDEDKNITPIALQNANIDKLTDLASKNGYTVQTSSSTILEEDVTEYEFSKDDDTSPYFDVYVNQSDNKTLEYEYYLNSDNRSVSEKLVKDYCDISNKVELDEGSDGEADVVMGTTKIGGKDAVTYVGYDGNGSVSIQCLAYDQDSFTEEVSSYSDFDAFTNAKSFIKAYAKYMESEYGYTEL